MHQENFRPQTSIEEILDDLAVEWRFEPAVALAEIDFDKSLRNQTRLGTPVIYEIQNRYRDEFLHGRAPRFPAIVVAETRSGYVIRDGNHRALGAREAGLTHVGAYILAADTHPTALEVLGLILNNQHGLIPTEEQKLQHAVSLVRREMGVAQAARVVGLTEKKVRGEIKWEEVQDRLEPIGIKAGLRGRRSWLRLHSLRDDDVFAAASQLFVACKLSSDEVDNLVPAINAKSTSRDQLALIAAELDDRRQIIQQTAGGRLPRAQKPTTANVIHANVAAIRQTNPRQVRAVVGNDRTKRADLAAAARAASQHLITIAEVLEEG